MLVVLSPAKTLDLSACAVAAGISAYALELTL
jgi:hypothetical protein